MVTTSPPTFHYKTKYYTRSEHWNTRMSLLSTLNGSPRPQACTRGRRFSVSYIGLLNWERRVRVPVNCSSSDVRLLQCYENYLNGGSLTLLEAELVPDEFDHPMHHQALSTQYFEHAYELYMSGEVDFSVPLQAVEDRYGLSVAPKNDSNANLLALAVKNKRLKSLLDEESEKLAHQNAEYEQLKSSAVSLTFPVGQPLTDQTAAVRNGAKTK